MAVRGKASPQVHLSKCSSSFTICNIEIDVKSSSNLEEGFKIPFTAA